MNNDEREPQMKGIKRYNEIEENMNRNTRMQVQAKYNPNKLGLSM